MSFTLDKKIIILFLVSIFFNFSFSTIFAEEKITYYEVKSGVHVLNLSKNNLTFLEKGWLENLKKNRELLKMSLENTYDLSKVKVDNLKYDSFRYRSFFEFYDYDKNLIILNNPNGFLFSYDINTKQFSEINSNLHEILSKQKISLEAPFLKVENTEAQFYWLTSLGARDMEIIESENKRYLLVLASIQKNKFCMKDVIFKAEINIKLDNLNFDKIFEEGDCSFRGPNQASSRIKQYDDEHILITQGLGQLRDSAEKSNIFSTLPVNEWPTGKILKINFKTGKYEIYSKGHRNPQGLTVLNDKTIVSSEHGPKGGDEINIIKKGANYGWPNVSYGIDYSEALGPLNKNHLNYEEPLYYFIPSIGISEIKLYDNENLQRWKKNLIISSMKKKSLFRLDIDWEKLKILTSEEIKIDCRIRDMDINNEGKIYLLCDNLDFIQISKSINDYK